jgi:CBS domain containing-hemolysin-like protein
MHREYSALPASGIYSAIGFHQPAQPDYPRVRAEDAAEQVMTDFTRVRAITVAPGMTMHYALQRMIQNRVRLLLVVDEHNRLLGLITTTDIQGEKPLRLLQARGARRDELLVADVMTPRERLETIDMDDVRNAKVGHVVATLRTVGRQHALVVDRDARGTERVRGLFSSTQIERQLGTVIDMVEVANSFAQIEEMLAH